MLAQGRRRGLIALRKAASQEGQHYSSNRLAKRALSVIPSNRGPTICATSSTRTVESFPTSFWKLHVRWYHETDPYSQIGIKIPERKNFIRANSSASASSIPKRRNGTRGPRRKDEFLDEEDLELERQLSQNEIVSPEKYTEIRYAEDYSEAAQEQEQGTIFPVEAYYAAKNIDLPALIVSNVTKDATRKRKHNRDYFLMELPSSNSNPDNTTSSGPNAKNPSYVAVYRFGSVIFLNVCPRVQAQMLQSIKRYSTEPHAQGFEQKDSFGVCVLPNTLITQVTPEHCIVPKLNMNAVAVISEVMAQSVALESYNEIVDSLLDNFAVLNSKISTSSKMDLDKKMLFSKIAQNNRIFIDLISKLRIKGRSQLAWDQGEYEIIHSGMTVEFDIDDRFELIQFKLDLIQQNSKLFLEVIQHQKSASLEWIIVVLIGFECVLMILEMSGQGTVMFESIMKMLP